jgi:NitT/TauT family transport system substrate-binding protein
MLKNFVVLALVATLLAACGGTTPPAVTQLPSEETLVEVKVPMGYIPNVQFAPFYVAAERGYFKDAGIKVEFDYSLETDGVALVGANTLQFGVASGDQVLQARAQGLPITYVMAWYQKYPVSIISVEDQNIHTPQDLKGKTIGLPGQFGASYVALRAVLHTAGLQESDVTLDSIGFNQVEAFTAGKNPIIVGYAANEPVILTAKGYSLNELRVADYAQLASNGIITNEKTIQENPELVRKFVAALVHGIQDTIADRDAAYEICKNYVPNLDQVDATTQKQVLATSIQLWNAPVIGVSDAASWENMQKVLLDMKLYSTALDVSKAFTNDFLPK